MWEPSVFIYILCFVAFLKFLGDGLLNNIVRTTTAQFQRHSRTLLLSVLFVVLSLLLDGPLIHTIKHLKTPSLRWSIGYIEELGSGDICGSILIVCFFVALLMEQKRLQHLFSTSFLSLLTGGLSVNILKIIMCRPRPSANPDPFQFFHFVSAFQNKPLLDADFLSMPSGHTVTIVSAAVPIILSTRNRFLQGSLILLTVLVSVARLYKVLHWPSDIFGGAILGISIGWVFYQHNFERLQPHNRQAENNPEL